MSKLHKYINIDVLPKKNGFGKNGNKQIIDWENTIGTIINFKYGEINGELKIIYYKKLKLTVEYKNEIFEIGTESLKTCNLGKILNVRTHQYKINIGETINDNSRDLTIIDREYRVKSNNDGYKIYEKWYCFKCNKCGHINWKIESSLLGQKCGCPICCNHPKVATEGVSSIVDTDLWMVKYFQGGYDEAKLYSHSSKTMFYPVCPECGETRNKQIAIYTIYRTHSVGCPCGDGKSYPEKLMYSMLKQLEIDFIPEYSPSWIKPKRYDFYFKLNNKEYIIEMDGNFHNVDNKMNGQTLEETKAIDDEKELLASERGINVIRIDCYLSGLEYVKNNILQGQLSHILNLENIDWVECEKFALSNLLKLVCEYKKAHMELFSKDIAKVFKISNITVIRYLKTGTKIGWCNYNPIEEHLRIRYSKTRNNGDIPIKCPDLNMTFKSATLFVKWYENKYDKKLVRRNICSVCNGKRNHVNNLTFKYITKQEFNNHKQTFPELTFGDFFYFTQRTKR